MVFKNKIAFVSGGMGDIGQAICRAFAELGATIACCDLLPPTEVEPILENWQQEYKTLCHYQQVDVSDAQAVKKWTGQVCTEVGIPSFIIPNAATATLAGIMDITAEQWVREINTNLHGAFYMAREATQKLLDHKLGGHVVFIGSWAAHAVHQNMPAYSVAKAGLRMLCKSLALELAPHQVLVNEIAPGYVLAGLSGKIWQQQPDFAQKCRDHVPTGQIMSADEVAAQVVYLCRPENKHITGSTLLMDGGLSLLC